MNATMSSPSAPKAASGAAKKEITEGTLDRFVRKAGRHAVKGAPGLKLNVRDADKGLRFWTHRFRVAGRQTETSLGAYPEVTLGEALVRYHEQRAQVRQGVDPIALKHAERRHGSGAVASKGMTFAQAAEDYIAVREAAKDHWTSAQHRRQWRQTLLEGPVMEILGPMPVARIDTAAVLKVLRPMWMKTPETASRVRNRIENVLGAADVQLGIDRRNPARWKDCLSTQFPKLPDPANHAAMPWKDVPAFIASLRKSGEFMAPAIEMVVLTACRLDEVLGMEWGEIDWGARVWTLPKERMKGRDEQSVPLTGRMVEIIEAERAAHPLSRYVFLGQRAGRKVNGSTARVALARVAGDGVTLHGFRSSFRTWCSDTGVAFEVAEQCLAHKVGNTVSQVYNRTTMLERRRPVYAAWADHCAGESKDNVVSIGKRA
jgi:integrase